MLEYIRSYLEDNGTPEYAKTRMAAIRLIQAQGLYSPIDSLVDIIDTSTTADDFDTNMQIDEFITNILSDILTQMYIMARGDLVYKTKFIQGMNLIEDYIDSDVILENTNEEESASEVLLHLLDLVTSEGVEYFDEFLIDVRPTLITNIAEHHKEQVESTVDGSETTDKTRRVKLIKEFNEMYPNTFMYNALKEGTITIGRDLKLLLSAFRTDIYRIQDHIGIAANIFMLVLVSDTDYENVKEYATNLVTDLFNELETVRDVKHHINSIQL